MLPILATTAVSAASDIISNLADRIGKGPAKTAPPIATAPVPFATLVDQATLAQRAQELTTRIGQSVEVASAAAAAGAPVPTTLQIDADGNTALQLPDGTLKPVALSESLRGAARELYSLRHPVMTGPAPMRPPTPLTFSVS